MDQDYLDFVLVTPPARELLGGTRADRCPSCACEGKTSNWNTGRIPSFMGRIIAITMNGTLLAIEFVDEVTEMDIDKRLADIVLQIGTGYRRIGDRCAKRADWNIASTARERAIREGVTCFLKNNPTQSSFLAPLQRYE